MKPWKLLLFSLVPTAAGYLVNLLILRPGGMLLNALVSPAMAVFCFWLGRRCGRRGPSFPRALALTQWPSAVSFALYVWQFHFVADDARNLLLAGLTQYHAGAMLFAASRLLRPFISYGWGPTESLLLIALSLLLLAALFSAGYWWGHTPERPE